MPDRLLANLKKWFDQIRGSRLRSLAAVSLVAVVSGILVNACSSFRGGTIVAPLEIPGATWAGNRACYECHTNYVRSFAASPHGRMHFDAAKFAGETGCESCHGPGSKHIAAGGGRGRFILNPGKDPGACF